MIDASSYYKFLGKFHGETDIVNLMNEFDITEKPKLPRGDIDAYLTNHKKGIDFTFTDERHLDVKAINYPEGALVLSNIRFNGVADKHYKKYDGTLPEGVSFGMSKLEVIKLMGNPVVGRRNLRWDREGYCFFAEFDDADKLIEFAIQLPVA